jgi:hypothetical protein
MCLACEEQEYFFRVWCASFLARGEMPPGVTAEDLQALGLPQPKEVADAGQQTPAAQNRKAQRPAASPNAFACNSPDE